MAEAQPAALQDRLTLILTTSPIVSHPSSEVLDACLASTAAKLPQLLDCRMLIMCDGWREGRLSLKRGKVPAELGAAYEEYKRKLRARVDDGAATGFWASAELVELGERKGFGHAVKRGLELARTPYVLIMQHDHTVHTTFDVANVLSFMEAHCANYVKVPLKSSFKHLNVVLATTREDTRKTALAHGGDKFCKSHFWYDSLHFARRRAYLELVFGPESVVKQGLFIEDSFGHLAMRQQRDNPALAASKYRMYTLQVGGTDTLVVRHLRGARFLREDQHSARPWGAQRSNALAAEAGLPRPESDGSEAASSSDESDPGVGLAFFDAEL